MTRNFPIKKITELTPVNGCKNRSKVDLMLLGIIHVGGIESACGDRRPGQRRRETKRNGK
jgi:hypothetical protein